MEVGVHLPSRPPVGDTIMAEVVKRHSVDDAWRASVLSSRAAMCQLTCRTRRYSTHQALVSVHLRHFPSISMPTVAPGTPPWLGWQFSSLWATKFGWRSVVSTVIVLIIHLGRLSLLGTAGSLLLSAARPTVPFVLHFLTMFLIAAQTLD